MVEPNRLLDQTDLSIGEVKAMVRFDVLDASLDRIGGLQPLKASAVEAKAAGTIKRTLNGVQIGDKDLHDVNPFKDRLRPVYVLGDGTEWPLGVFMFTALPKLRGTLASTMDATLMDQGFMLDQESRRTYSVPAGGSIAPLIRRILEDSGVPLAGAALPETGTSAKVLDPVVWPAGTQRSKILDELCTLAGWLPGFFDNTGNFRIKSPPDTNAGYEPDHVYHVENSRVLRSTIMENQNLLDAPNVFTVISNGPTDGEISASAVVDPSLPFSREQRGFEITSTTRMQGIASTADAQRLANALASGAGTGFLVVDFQALPDPRHDLMQTVQWDGMMFRETGWSLGLPLGPHSHSLAQGGFTVGG